MGRSKRSDAPAGTLGAGDLQRWLERTRSQLGAAGIKASFGEAPRKGGARGPTWVSMTSARAHGRLIRSPDGSTSVAAHSLPDGAALLDERHPHTNQAQLDALVAALGSSRRPTASRA